MRYIFLLCLGFFKCLAQTSSNGYYAPFHKTNTLEIPVAKIGHYCSVGVGLGGMFQNAGFAKTVSYSLAWKSQVISFSANNLTPVEGGGGTYSPYFENSNMSILIGEAYRSKNTFASVSVGIASSSLEINNIPHPTDFFRYTGVSIPVELKTFLVAYKGIGVGVHMAKHFIPGNRYSPSLITLALVFGQWNKSK